MTWHSIGGQVGFAYKAEFLAIILRLSRCPSLIARESHVRAVIRDMGPCRLFVETNSTYYT